MPTLAEAPVQSAGLIKAARRITVKVGSSLLVSDSGDGIRRDWLSSLGHDIERLRQEGRQVVIVSSGAVALGRRRLSLKHSARLAMKQAAAASGQPLLMRAWEEATCPACLILGGTSLFGLTASVGSLAEIGVVGPYV